VDIARVALREEAVKTLVFDIYLTRASGGGRAMDENVALDDARPDTLKPDVHRTSTLAGVHRR
jgi:hypothetical protein